MLTYDDCVSFCVLASEEIAAIARHEHVPEIVALEMGAWLCETPEGRQVIRRMIFDDIEAACRKGDARTAGGLGLVLHRFSESHPDSREAAEMLAASDVVAPWLRERVHAYFGAMMRHFGVDRGGAWERFRAEMRTAEMCCARCRDTARCCAFLADTADGDEPSAFCPNAPVLQALADKLRKAAAA